MSKRVLQCLALAAMLLVWGTALHAEEAAGGEAKKERKGGEHPAGMRSAQGVEFILKHAQDLNLTEEQITKLKDLADKEAKQREAVDKDPAIIELRKKMADAKAANDEAALKSLHKEYMEAVKKAGGGNSSKEAIAAVLTKEQIEKLDELRKQEQAKKMEGHKAGGATEGKKSEGGEK
jgi:Spy/CpxP family protein refolding chaperone